jgi:GT2 family glycosyltransferase
MKNLYIVITDFNGYPQTQRCLKALAASQYQEFTILLVDHGTTDTTKIGLAKDFPHVIRLEGSSELWWTGATNLGIRGAIERGADAVMLLNNDCYVTLEAIAALVEASNRNPGAIIAPVQLDWQSGEITSISPWSCFLLGFPTRPGPQKLTPAMMGGKLLPVKLIIGGRGVIIPDSVFGQIGLFDEKRLPHYGADHDFFLRAKKQQISLYVMSNVFVYIDSSITTQANNPAALNSDRFLESLRVTGSHRNLRDVTALFKAQYPVPYIYFFGVILYMARYFMLYSFKRILYLLRNFKINISRI